MNVHAGSIWITVKLVFSWAFFYVFKNVLNSSLPFLKTKIKRRVINLLHRHRLAAGGASTFLFNFSLMFEKALLISVRERSSLRQPGRVNLALIVFQLF